MMRLEAAIQSGLTFLATQQGSDGGFLGHASADKDDFTDYHEHPTVFFTALIMSCLEEVAGGQEIKQKATGFLLRHASPQWSWNYWIPGSPDATSRPYPDDLDDTACALAALHSYDPGLLDGAVLGHLAQALTANEAAPGGPYETWLIDRTANPKWQDVDLAVNANIGYLLARLGVYLPSLEIFITSALQAKTLKSSYYCGEIPLLYFMARWYRGDALRRRIAKALFMINNQTNSLDGALLLSAGIQVGLGRQSLAPAARRLVEQQHQKGFWPASALYYEPLVKGVKYYAGSEALTTAFALEALSNFERQQPAVPDRLQAPVNRHPGIIGYALSEAQNISDPSLRRHYRALIRGLAKADDDRQISGMASLVARACNRPIVPKTVRRLNLASLHGWIAYTIYDDFLDNEGAPERLSLANLALRRSLASFRAALPSDEAFAGLVADTFDQVDGANNWEISHTRPVIKNGHLQLSHLPDHGNYSQLARRSWGHMLAASGVLYGLGYAADSPEVLALQDFFHHFLIARQLNDDAHDWEDDLSRGQLTAVVSLLLGESLTLPTRLNIEAEIENLRLQFWQTTIVSVAELITQHLQAARRALASCDAIEDKTTFESWLLALDSATELALHERQETYKFMAAYGGKSL
jgi:hypothetical protein